jgi:glycosyltransferase EpsD
MVEFNLTILIMIESVGMIKMKVLLTATVQSHICQFHRPLVEVLHEKGYEVHVAAKDNLAEKNGLKLDFVEKVYDIPFSRSPKSKDNLKAYKELKKIIEQEQYEVIHCNTPMGGIVTRLAARNVRKQGTKVYYTAHGFHFYKGAPIKNWIVFYPIEKMFSKLTDVLITITHEDYRLAKEKFYCQVKHIHGVGVDEKRYYPVSKEEQLKIRKALGFAPEQKIILCIGELLPNKNQQMAIRMMEKVVKWFPNAKLLLAGNGPEKDNLERLIKKLGLEKSIDMLGYCTYLEKYQRITDVLVACSKREGLPLNLVEAMLTGNSVVASMNRGHRELIKSGKNSYLVNSIDEMAERVIALLNDNELRESMGKCAKEYAHSYSYANVKEELEKIYFGE